ncbi:unnamed protein product [Orchesella dallaii]|uniref:Band 7 domain-containing protein n=1 Tax=Orchesella dallaii TaxID=48710 RepID=A0ABP1Q7Y3_9HEXA
MGYQGAAQSQHSQLLSNLQEYQDSLKLRKTGNANRTFLDISIVLAGWVVYVIFFPIICWCVPLFHTVHEYQRVVNFRLGKIDGGPRGPGKFFFMPFYDEVHILDIRTLNYDIPEQIILTKDSVTVLVDAVVFYRVFDPILAVANVIGYDKCTHLLAATTLRNALGTSTLTEILTQRDELARQMRDELDEATDPWGVKVERIELKNIYITDQGLQKSMASEAEALREAKAKVIAAESEVIAARALKNAANTLLQSSGAFQLRTIQVMEEVSTQGKSTIVIPTSCADIFK